MTHINQRRDYAAVWTSDNPVLPLGQVGWERDTGKAKLGDGVTAWNALDYAVEPGPVTSVNGMDGVVVLDKDDIGLNNVDNTNDVGKPLSVPQKTYVDDEIADAVAAVLLAAHPVGSIYISTVDTNPSALFGGTWVAFAEGRTLIGVDEGETEFDTVEETGGEKTVTLTDANLPPHNHTMNHTHQSNSDATDGGSTLAFRRSSNGDPATGGGMVATFTGNTGNGPGTSTPVNNLPPYITTYMFKRTA